MITKATLVEQYERILARGCLSPVDQKRLRQGEPVEGIVVQQSGGSSGEPPLRLPRTQAEMNWLAAKLLVPYLAQHGEPPQRIALLGGVSHTAATERIEIEGPVQVRDFSGSELAALDAFDPDVISMYPSFAREIIADRTMRLTRLKAVKLGGEPILASDLAKLRDRFGDIGIVEQFGSTEMPALAFRTHGPGPDTGYELSTDRYDFDFDAHDDWQPLVVRDRFPERAFPIDDWFDTGDEVRVDDATIREVRRRNDPTVELIEPVDRLLRHGCIHVQVLPRESLLLCAPGSSALSPTIALGHFKLKTRIEQPYRLIDSNKMPLLVDTQRMNPARLYQQECKVEHDG